MDGAGVLYTTQEPLEVAALIDAVIDDEDLCDRVVRKQDEALARLRRKDFDGTLLGFVDQVLNSPRKARAAGRLGFLGSVPAGRRAVRASAVPPRDFSRPAGQPGAENRPCRGEALMRVNQWVPAAHNGDAIGDSSRRMRDLLRAMGHDSEIFALTIDDDLRRRNPAVLGSGARSAAMSRSFISRCHRRCLQRSRRCRTDGCCSITT